MMNASDVALFALDGGHDYGARVARALGVGLSPHEERAFEDGEHKARPLVSVRGKDVFVVASLHAEPNASANDKLCRLLFFLGALRDASAARVTAVVPYLCYSRQDRKADARDPVTTRYVAALFEAVGTDRIVTMDVHDLAAYQNAFRCESDHLEATGLFVEHFATIGRDSELVVVAPDAGGIDRAQRFRSALGRRLGRTVDAAFVEKYRAAGLGGQAALTGEVNQRTAIIFDDMISTGGTIVRAAEAVRRHGATRVYAAATHGLFAGDADTRLGAAVLEQIVVTDTAPSFRLSARGIAGRTIVLDTSGLVGEAIRRIHTGESLVALLDGCDR